MKATTWIEWKGKRTDIIFGMSAGKAFQKLTGMSILEMDDDYIKKLGIGFIDILIRAGMSHFNAKEQPTEAEVDDYIDSLEREIEPADPSTWLSESEAAADVIDRTALGQEPRVEKTTLPRAEAAKLPGGDMVPDNLETVDVWRVVDVPTPPKGDTFLTLSKRIADAFADGLPVRPQKRKSVARPTT